MSDFGQFIRHVSFVALVLAPGLAAAQATSSVLKSALAEPEASPLDEADRPLLTARKSKLSVTAGMLGSSKEDVFMNSKFMSGTLGISGETAFTDYLSAQLALGFQLSSGNYSNRYSEEGSAPNATYLDKALIELRPFSFISLQAGIISTEFSSFASTFEANGFPGVREALNLKGETLAASIYAMQAIPTSSTPSVKMTESGVTSAFKAYGTEIGTNPDDKGILTLKASYLRFQFDNLTSSAAKDSEGLGNTVIVPSGAQPRFVYGFSGNEVGLGGTLKITGRTSLRLGGTLLRNDEAPDKKNRGYVYSGGFTTRVFRGDLSVTGGYFYNESDTLPASYASGARAANNRFGQYVNIKHELKKDQITSFMKYVRANEIEDLPKTADRDHVSVGLEVAYEIL